MDECGYIIIHPDHDSRDITTSIITATKESYKIMLFHIMTDILHFIMIELCHRVSYFRSGFPFDRKGFRQSMVEILLDSVFDGTMLQESY
jgi:hypothetical protein